MRQSHILGVVLLVVILALLAAFARHGGVDIRDQVCRFRLDRLGKALGLWMEDNGRDHFPAIENPPPGAPWHPDRPHSIENVLWRYLDGDAHSVPRAGESDADYLSRRRSSEMSVCPVSGLEYWYDADGLSSLTPWQLAAGHPAQCLYFRCQQLPDGHWPHQAHGKGGVYGVYGSGDVQDVTPAETAGLHRQLAQLELQVRQRPDAALEKQVEQLRLRLADLDHRVDSAADVKVSVGHLTSAVAFLPQGREAPALPAQGLEPAH